MLNARNSNALMPNPSPPGRREGSKHNWNRHYFCQCSRMRSSFRSIVRSAYDLVRYFKIGEAFQIVLSNASQCFVRKLNHPILENLSYLSHKLGSGLITKNLRKTSGTINTICGEYRFATNSTAAAFRYYDWNPPTQKNLERTLNLFRSKGESLASKPQLVEFSHPNSESLETC